MKKLLLHICCAPDQTVAFERTREEFQVTGFFSNSCIEPRGEYYRRLADAKRLAEMQGMELLEDEYFPNSFLELSKGLEKEPERGRRCLKCIEYRLRRTAEAAALNGFEYFATTLTVSPHKDADFINRKGTELALEFDIEYLQTNFKKQDGFKRSLELSAEMNLYRQDYCGCRFSLRDKLERQKQREDEAFVKGEGETEAVKTNKRLSAKDKIEYNFPPGAFFKPEDQVSRRFRGKDRKKG